MRRASTILALLALSVGLTSAGCEEEEAEPTTPAANEGSASLEDWVEPGAAAAAGDPHAPGADPHAMGAGAPGIAPEGQPDNVRAVQGTIRERQEAAGYTYFRVETAGGDVWIAAMQPGVDVGDQITAVGTLMQDFRSNALDRTFPELLLAGRVDEGLVPPGRGGPGGGGPHGGAPGGGPHGAMPAGGPHGAMPAGGPHGGGAPAPHGGAPAPHGGAPAGHP